MARPSSTVWYNTGTPFTSSPTPSPGKTLSEEVKHFGGFAGNVSKVRLFTRDSDTARAQRRNESKVHAPPATYTGRRRYPLPTKEVVYRAVARRSAEVAAEIISEQNLANVTIDTFSQAAANLNNKPEDQYPYSFFCQSTLLGNLTYQSSMEAVTVVYDGKTCWRMLNLVKENQNTRHVFVFNETEYDSGLKKYDMSRWGFANLPEIVIYTDFPDMLSQVMPVLKGGGSVFIGMFSGYEGIAKYLQEPDYGPADNLLLMGSPRADTPPPDLSSYILALSTGLSSVFSLMAGGLMGFFCGAHAKDKVLDKVLDHYGIRPEDARKTNRTYQEKLLKKSESMKDSVDGRNSLQVNREPDVSNGGNENRPFPPGEDDQPPPATRTGRTGDTIILMEEVESDDESS